MFNYHRNVMNKLIIHKIIPSTTKKDSNKSTDDDLSMSMIMKINSEWINGRSTRDRWEILPTVGDECSNDQLTKNKETITKMTNLRCSRHLWSKFHGISIDQLKANWSTWEQRKSQDKSWNKRLFEHDHLAFHEFDIIPFVHELKWRKYEE